MFSLSMEIIQISSLTVDCIRETMRKNIFVEKSDSSYERKDIAIEKRDVFNDRKIRPLQYHPLTSLHGAFCGGKRDSTGDPK